MKTITLNAQIREEFGKEISKKLRADGMMPAIFYGYNIDPVAITVDAYELLKALKGENRESVFVKLKISGEDGSVEKLSVIKDLQIDTVKKMLIHADFYELKMDRELTLNIPISLIGDSIGVEEGGALDFIKRDLKVSALPNALPEAIEVDISQLGIGDSLKVGDIAVNKEITILDAEDIAVVAVVAARQAMVEEEEAVEEIEGTDAAGGVSEAEEAAE